ncbi:cyclic nucleotide-binding domain-containing protein [Chitinimonas arctica]|uniref:Cyclic nucleotide-binding domain-containing protein n=1 Tax=Chitinimonas arctica TaxID=2594795 RepID=A0A516SDS5_9NEIS|nr:cyclic nucleotide-binding domain-containing protein [Chitinimonas arctica]QDQ26312.1 cyclic nucleotide-binding domain-containing protein [Chitinimonas arctica]
MQDNGALVQKLLQSVRLFSGFSPEEARQFLAACRVEQHPAGKRLLNEGEDGSEMYVLLSGNVTVRRFGGVSEYELTRLGPGETFGELALIDFGWRSASVEAVGYVRVLVFARDSLSRVPALEAKLYRNLAIMLASRLRETDARLTDMAEQSAEMAAFAKLATQTQQIFVG